RLRLADRVQDHAILVQAVHDLPVEAFPGPESVVEGQVEQRKHGIVDLGFVDLRRLLHLGSYRSAPAMVPPSTVVTSAVVLSANAWCRNACATSSAVTSRASRLPLR